MEIAAGMFRSLWGGRTRESSVSEASSDSSLPQVEGRGNWVDSRKNRQPEQSSVDPAHQRPVERVEVDNSGENGTSTTTAAAAAAIVVDPVQSPDEGTSSHHVDSAAVAHRKKPRTPRSASAIRDGRKFLAAYRRSKAASSSASPPDATPVRSSTTTATEGSSSHHQSASRSGGGKKAVNSSVGVAAATSAEVVWRNQAEASGVARNLEGSLIHNSDTNQCEHSAADVGNGVPGGSVSSGVHGKGNIATSTVENGPGAAGGLEQQRREGEEMEEGIPPDGQGSSSSSRSPERPTAEVMDRDLEKYLHKFVV